MTCQTASDGAAPQKERENQLNRSTEALFLVSSLIAGCSRDVELVRTLPLPRLNPTSRTFDLPVTELKGRILEIFASERQWKDPVFPRVSYYWAPMAGRLQPIFEIEHAASSNWSKAMFQDRQNANDVYLHSPESVICLSPVYRGPQFGMPYCADFHIHLLTESDAQTRLEVKAIDSRIINGQLYGYGPCGCGFATRTEPVEPTTVEEYQVLLYLARHLGVTNMPDVILPVPPAAAQ